MNLVQTHAMRVDTEEMTLEKQFSKFWELEGLGISPQENSVYQTFKDGIEFVNGRYQVHLPWKQDHPLLSDNFTLAQRRLQGFNSRLQGNSNLLEEYDSIIKDQEEKGIIEQVTSSENIEVRKTHYLNHHPVIRQDKDTIKVRIVYNTSAKNSSGTSLNSCLYPGPCLLKAVAEILVRFRFYPIVLTADIEKAFLMIGIHPSNCDVLRFLWYEDAKSETLQGICYRFCGVVFGVVPSPFLLNAILVWHTEDYL